MRLDGAKDKKLSIGFICDTIPNNPPLTGGTNRLYHLSKSLIKLGHSPHWFICNRFAKSQKDLIGLEDLPCKSLQLIPPKTFYCADKLSRLINKTHIDILQFESSQEFLRIGPEIRKLTGLPIVLEMHDIEADLAEIYRKSNNRDLSYFVQYLAGFYSDAVVSMTPGDTGILIDKLQLPKDKVFLVPNGIKPISQYRGEKEERLVFLGNMHYPPNAEGLSYFIKKAWPQVSERHPNAELLVVGMAPEALIKNLSSLKIHFYGRITDMVQFRKILGTSSVGLCVLAKGSGMKVKILDYANAGLPIVATPLGISGYEQIKSIVSCRLNPQEISNACSSLLADKEGAKLRGERTRREILKYFNWNKLAKGMERVYDRAISGASLSWENMPLPESFWLSEKRGLSKVSSSILTLKK